MPVTRAALKNCCQIRKFPLHEIARQVCTTLKISVAELLSMHIRILNLVFNYEVVVQAYEIGNSVGKRFNVHAASRARIFELRYGR